MFDSLLAHVLSPFLFDLLHADLFGFLLHALLFFQSLLVEVVLVETFVLVTHELALAPLSESVGVEGSFILFESLLDRTFLQNLYHFGNLHLQE